MAAGQSGVATSEDGDVDITFAPSTFNLEFHLLGGDDHVDARGTGGAGLKFLGPIVITGGDGNESLLRGGAASDVIDGGAGADLLDAQDGNDIAARRPRRRQDRRAGGGNDSIDGGPGIDTMNGNDGDDTFLRAGRRGRRARSAAAPASTRPTSTPGSTPIRSRSRT